jgi:molybdopterin-guanine dinucleotide biosynthesis protein A
MSAAFLQSLLARCSTEGGVVAKHGDFFEPLAAVYPKRIEALARKHLQEGRYAMQELIREAVNQGILKLFPLATRIFRSSKI